MIYKNKVGDVEPHFFLAMTVLLVPGRSNLPAVMKNSRLERLPENIEIILSIFFSGSVGLPGIILIEEKQAILSSKVIVSGEKSYR